MKENKLLIGVRVDADKRFKIWRKYAEVKDNKLETFGEFDAKIYELGLQKIQEVKK